MTVAAVVQARMGSTRLPGKVLEAIAGTPMLGHVLQRAKAIPGVDMVILATTSAVKDASLVALAKKYGARCFRGSENDVLERYYQAAKANGVDTVVRVTADCPLLDPEVSGLVVARFNKGNVDYASNSQPPTYPDGLDTEVFSFQALVTAWREARLPSQREHVTPYIWGSPQRFRLANVAHRVNLSEMRWTVDEPQDLEFLRGVCRYLRGDVLKARMADVLQVLELHPELLEANAGIQRNEGLKKSLREDEAFLHRAKEGR
jgi:spore coat polysaccharide biosynthesis protein SpsF